MNKYLVRERPRKWNINLSGMSDHIVVCFQCLKVDVRQKPGCYFQLDATSVPQDNFLLFRTSYFSIFMNVIALRAGPLDGTLYFHRRKALQFFRICHLESRNFDCPSYQVSSGKPEPLISFSFMHLLEEPLCLVFLPDYTVSNCI